VATARFDGVTAGLRVNANLHAPLLCVENVFKVASGNLEPALPRGSGALRARREKAARRLPSPDRRSFPSEQQEGDFLWHV
jgi:hypothetical protein